MIARSNSHPAGTVPPVLPQLDAPFALTRNRTLCLAGGVLAFWIAVLAVFGGMHQFHRRSTASNGRPVVVQQQASEMPPSMSVESTSASTTADGEQPTAVSAPQPVAEPERPAGPSPEMVLVDLQQTLEKMTADTNRSLNNLDAFLIAMIRNDEALSQFAQEMFSAESKARCIFDPQGHREWCKERFTQLVLDPDDLTNYLDRMYGSLNTDFLRTRAEELVRLKLDQDLDHHSFGLASTEGNPVRTSLNKAARNAAIRAANDVPECIARQVVSWIASYVASEATKALVGDSEEGQWLAFGMDIVVGDAVDDALYQNANPEGKLIASLRQELTELREKLLDPESSQSARRQLQELLDAHSEAQLKALSNWLPELKQDSPSK